MNKSKGFTLIELLIVVVVALLFVTVAVGAVQTANSNSGSVSYGINGLTEVRCINGYSFVVGEGGSARQVMDEFGHGAKCQ